MLLTPLVSVTAHPQRSTLFPYTTLFRSPPSRGLFRSRLRDARIRSKLGLILVIPLIAVIALAGLRLVDRKSTRLNSSHVKISYAVFCLKKKRRPERVGRDDGIPPLRIDT